MFFFRGRSPRVTPSSGQASLVLMGPVVGKVTDTTANILLEVDDTCTVTCVATPRGSGGVVKYALQLQGRTPGVFVLKGLAPSTQYHVTFHGGMAKVHEDKLKARGCVVRTFPAHDDIKQMRIVACSCDYPTRLQDGDLNLWDHLSAECKSGRCDLMLHLGDQVYTWEHGCMTSAMRVMDEGKMDHVTPTVRDKMETMSRRKLQESYQRVWSLPGKASTLAHSSHLMIWSDNDVTNDFTILRKKDGSQEYDADFLSVAMYVYRSYQRALWDPPASLMTLEQVRAQPTVKEWHFHTYGPCGIFLIDSRGNRIQPNGELYGGLPDLLCDEQRKAITDAFASPDLRCMILCSEIPFLGPDPSTIKETAKKLAFLKDHWAHQIHELVWLMDQAFAWKAAVPGREVLLLGGDIHVGVESTVTDSQTGLTIRQLTAGPITNAVSQFHCALEGRLNDRYTYQHTPKDKERNFGSIELDFRGDSVVMEARVIRQSEMAQPPKPAGTQS
mmetsp:Transcript_44594/g.129706  ORF Transcript_44594/g.129706 Transcript_44594/m.129706 type:complete len:500 (-) Transcript_44594:88-1587(-)